MDVDGKLNISMWESLKFKTSASTQRWVVEFPRQCQSRFNAGIRDGVAYAKQIFPLSSIRDTLSIFLRYAAYLEVHPNVIHRK